MKKIFILFVFFITSSVFAQQEFLVNTHIDTTQRDPKIARDANGNYIVVWKSTNQVSADSKGDIYFQRFNTNDSKTGNETPVNTTTAGEQDRPSVAMNSNGDFIIAWASFTDNTSILDIKARLYKNNLPVGNEFLVNSTTLHTQNNPDVDVKDNGEFIIVWDSWYQDGSDRGVYAQRFNSNGEKVGIEFQVNTTTAYSQARPKVRYRSDGSFIITWESWRQDILTQSGYGMFGRIFDASANSLTNEFQINTHTHDYQWFGDLDVFDDNSFVVVWCSWEQDGDDGGIYFQRFSSSAEKIGNETLVNRTTVNYQWLPKVRKMIGNEFAIIWSSWKQDGGREGVYAKLFNEEGIKVSLETQVNDYTEGFQWEPDMISSGENEIVAVWSSWEPYGKDYEITGKRLTFHRPQGVINPQTYTQTSGSSTTKIIVHVLDSAQVTGNTYRVTFDTLAGRKSALAHIENLTTPTQVISDFRLDRGEETFYITPMFDGIAVQFLPVFNFKLDVNGSYFVNNSGTNLITKVSEPTVGQKKIAPIQAVVIWGKTDTLANGQYATPLDTAMGLDGQKNILLPFKGLNLTTNSKINFLVREPASTKNGRWDPKEDIVLLTPPPYQVNPFNTHAQIITEVPQGALLLPDEGDTNYVLTRLPIGPDDIFTFTTNPAFIIADTETDENHNPYSFELYQNYPNPFNPSTTVKFSLPKDGIVKLDIYNILGQKVSELLNEVRNAGTHKILFDASNMASGVYIYSLQFENRIITKKMILLR